MDRPILPLVHSFPLSSDKRSNGTLAAPRFDVRNFELEKGDIIGLSFTIPPLSNVTSTLKNNTLEFDSQDAGGATTTVTLESTDVRFFSIANLLTKLKVKLDAQEIADGGSATYTCSYDFYTDSTTIEKSTGNFGFTVTAGDLMSFIGFNAGAYTGAGTYTTDNSANLYQDIVCVRSNLISFIQRGKQDKAELLSTSIAPQGVIDHIYVDEARQKFGIKSPARYYRVKGNTEISELSFEFVYLNGTQIEIRNPAIVSVGIYR